MAISSLVWLDFHALPKLKFYPGRMSINEDHLAGGSSYEEDTQDDTVHQVGPSFSVGGFAAYYWA